MPSNLMSRFLFVLDGEVLKLGLIGVFVYAKIHPPVSLGNRTMLLHVLFDGVIVDESPGLLVFCGCSQ